MQQRILAFALAVSLLLCAPANAAAYDGFSNDYGYTDTKNEYIFQPDFAFSYFNKEVEDDPWYDEISPGTEIYLPLYVNVGGDAEDDVPVTAKMVKDDNVTINHKVVSGADYVGKVELVDIKSLKLKDVTAGMYAKIPLARNYDRTGSSAIDVRLKISVNSVTHDYTEIELDGRIRNQITSIPHDSIYGAAVPGMFRSYSYTGEASFDFGGEIIYDGHVRRGESYFLNLSREPVPDIAAMYPGAWLDFYSFLGGNKTFDKIGELKIPVNRNNLARRGQTAELYVYRIDGPYLTALGAGVASFDPNTNRVTIRAKTLENYVLSNTALLQQITPDMNNNILRSGYAEPPIEPEAPEE